MSDDVPGPKRHPPLDGDTSYGEETGHVSDTSKPSRASDTIKGGDNNMTDYQGRNFWDDVKRGMEDLDDDLDDLADYVENGDYDDAVDTMVDAVNQVGGYNEARSTAESIAEYLDAVQDDVGDVYNDLEVHRQTLEQAAQDLEDVGFRQDELDSMSAIQQHVANR